MTQERQIVLVTGGSRGIGRSTVLELAARGFDTVFTYHSQNEAARQVAGEVEQRGGRAAVLQLDTGDVASFASFTDELRSALQEKWQRDSLDGLVNNAGVGVHASFADTSEQQFDQLLDVHFKGVFFLTQRLLPLLADGSRVVNVSSGLARFCLPGFSAYGAMKGAVEVMTRYLAQELGPRGISVNAVAPGAIETDFGGGVVRDDAATNAFVASTTAMGRAGLPDEIGGAIADLMAGDFHWMTAQRIELSGGQNL